VFHLILRRLYSEGTRGGKFCFLVTCRNYLEALRAPRSFWHSVHALRRYRNRLRHLRATTLIDHYDGSRIPSVVHFVYLYPPGDLLFYMLVAIRSAITHNPNSIAILHCFQAPTGPNAENILDRVLVCKVEQFTFFGTARINHPAHKADLVRLIALQEIGGIYLDLDTITARSFEVLRKYPFVMGVQPARTGEGYGLCNATMLSEPMSLFVTEWISHYNYFRSRGRDILWDFHSVKLPVRLAIERPEFIHVLDHDAFFFPLWDDVYRILFSEESGKYLPYLGNSFSFHIWQQFSTDFLNRIDESWVEVSKSNYARLARIALEKSDVQFIPRSAAALEVVDQKDAYRFKGYRV
jgi:Glycosyltransferase sugar-binding region containing DXD motif